MSDDLVPEDSGRLANVSAALLVGGASIRMGRDKSRVMVGGVACATRVARRLAALFEEVLLVGGDPPADAPGRRVPDIDGSDCALRGVVGALEAAREERVLLVAADLPLVTSELLLALVAWPEANAVVPRDREGRRQPLCAVYQRDAALAIARDRLVRQELALAGWLEALELRELPPEVMERVDPEGLALTNVNGPEDLARVEAALRQRE